LTDHPYQCIIPVFDGLLPEPHNSSILRLLFTCAHWHGLAKLRIHTDSTLRILDETTVSIGTEFRTFTAKTCAAFDTRELSREVEARKRRGLKKGRKKPASNGQSMSGDQAAPSAQSVPGEQATPNSQSVPGERATLNVQVASGDQVTPNAQSTSGNQTVLNVQVATNDWPNGTSVPNSTDCRWHNGPKRRKFNLRVYKYHALGDYAKTIRRLGTTDSFSTEPVSNYC
jgi:hypothetical protein